MSPRRRQEGWTGMQDFDAVLFDCDGVLVDSEGITNGVLRAMLEELGWRLTLDECMRIFLGKAVRDEQARIEAHIGRPLPEEWFVRFRERRNRALMEAVQPIPGAPQVVALLHERLAGRIACCSGADRSKVELQLGKCGLLGYFAGRVFSGHEMKRSKPFPDVYLAAMERLAVAPGRCAVVEDTVTGVKAGVAAGAVVFGYAPGGPGHDAAAALREAGAHAVIASLAELDTLVQAGR